MVKINEEIAKKADELQEQIDELTSQLENVTSQDKLYQLHCDIISDNFKCSYREFWELVEEYDKLHEALSKETRDSGEPSETIFSLLGKMLVLEGLIGFNPLVEGD